MATSKNVFSPSEFQFAFVAEANVGTKNATSMQLLNVDDIVTVTQEVTQTTDPRSSGARTLATADVFTNDQGGHLTTITMSVVLDTTVSPLLHSQALAVAVGSSPASYDLAYNFAPDALIHGGATDITGTCTLAFISPVSNESKYFTGCRLTEMTVSYDSGNEGGRARANLTWETHYRPADGAAAPTTPTAYGGTYRYLRQFGTLKQLGGADIVLNKVEYTISMPAMGVGFQGTNGDPEFVQVGIPSAGFSAVLGVKYDDNTAALWESRRAGTTLVLEIADNATWASATFGIKASFCKITGDVQPAGAGAGVFQDIPLIATASTSGDMVQIVP